MDAKFSPRVRDIMSYSHSEAHRLGNAYIGLEHLFLGMLKDGGSCAIQLLVNLNLNIEIFQQKLEASIRVVNPPRTGNENLPLTKQAERVLKYTYIIAKEFRSEMVRSEYIMLAILHEKNNIISQNLEFEGINYENFKEELIKYNSEMGRDLPKDAADPEPETPSSIFGGGDDDDLEDEEKPIERPKKTSNIKSKTPVLDNFGRDLTRAAEENRLDPVVGRDKELERIAQILSRRKKNNPILIGEPGVGKSAIAEGLAIRIIQHKVSRTLFNKRIVMLDIGSVVAGTKYRGQLKNASWPSSMNWRRIPTSSCLSTRSTPWWAPATPTAALTPPTCSSPHWPVASCNVSAPPPSTNTASTSRKTAPWNAASRR